MPAQASGWWLEDPEGNADTAWVDALFFMARREEALGVASSADLPFEPVADAIRLDDPSALLELAEVLGGGARIRPLRDATCRSFPVWEFGREITQCIAALNDAEIDSAAERWQEHAEKSFDTDLYELAGCLADLRNAIRAGDDGEALFVLLEERAW